MAGYWQLVALIFIIYFVSVATVEASFAVELCKIGSVPLVTGPQGVPDKSFGASSTWAYSYGHSPHQARLNRTINTDQSTGGWSAGKGRSGEFIQVRFNSVATICAIQTQGRNHYRQYVKSFRVKVSQDCGKFKDLEGNKVFNGNNDRDTIVTNKLHAPVLARCVRIVVVSFHGHPSLRFDVLGFRGSSCASRSHPLVSGKDGVSNGALTASSFYQSWDKLDECAAFHGRLHEKVSHTSAGAWLAKHPTPGDWIQVKFTNWKTICSVQTQGRQHFNQFVTRYHVMVSQDCDSWKDVEIQPGVWKIFNGNTDPETVVTNSMPAPVSALCLRIYLHAFHNLPAMRFEVLGFRESLCKGSVALVSGEHGIPDSALTASSVLRDIPSASPSDARLGVLYKKGISAGGWVAGNKRAGEWIQVKFRYRKTICSILTRGRGIYDQFVKTFYVSISQDCHSFTYIKENGVKKLFYGNKDIDSIVTNALPKSVSALCVRIVVDKYNNYPSMRFEIFGSKGRSGDQKCSVNPCKNGGTCMLAASGYSCTCTPDYAGRDCEDVNSCKNAGALFSEMYDGTKNDVINSAFTASSEYTLTLKDRVFHAWYARRISTRKVAWRSSKWRTPGEWIQVRFNNLKTICSVKVNGYRVSRRRREYVRKFFVRTSQDCVTFKDYTENGVRKIFTANRNKRYAMVKVMNKLPVPISALCVRLVVLESSRRASMCFGLIGFPSNPF